VNCVKNRLLWKLLLINIVPVIGITIMVVWLAIDKLAANYFMALMNKYDVSPTDIHQMFLSAIHRYLLWAAALALVIAFLLSYFLIRRVLRPLSQMTAITRQVAAGNFSTRVDVVTRDEVGELGAAFNRMADSLERMENLRKNMVADVAHDLRTPLTNLRGYLEALTDEVVPPSEKTFRMLQDEILHLVHLVDDLQQLAKADAARAYLNKQPFHLPEAINQVLELYRPNLEAKNITLHASYGENTERIQADREKVLQVLRNLIENAVKFTRSGGEISCTTEMKPEGVLVTVINSGEEISPDDLPYIFERFYKADRSRSVERGGAGIGLSIVKELIEAHGGTVGAESRDHLTRIWFTLSA
jgi:two-component system sensor histidine kinase BaeS